MTHEDRRLMSPLALLLILFVNSAIQFMSSSTIDQLRGTC